MGQPLEVFSFTLPELDYCHPPNKGIPYPEQPEKRSAVPSISKQQSMSEQDQDNHSGEQESVEEAVFKYVGVDLDDSKQQEQQRDSRDHSPLNEAREHKEHEDSALKEDKDKEAGKDEMDWFLRHDLSTEQPVDGTPHSVAAAAVAAAFAANEAKKRRNHEDGTELKPKKHKKAKSKKNKLQLAVDPELASLDDSEVTEHEQLVRKAILDADNIAHHPDFQQYLNTDDVADDSKDKKHGIDKVKVQVEEGQHVKPYSEISKTIVDGENVRRKVEVLPKVLAPGTDQDITNLIQDAATKASHIINPQAQSTGKSFDLSEEEALEQFIKDYQNIKNLSRRQICERIWSNERRKDDFWTNICKVLPYRTRSSIYKHVRRKYHIFEQRGRWTVGEDNELARLCAEKEGQWSEIGKLLGRMPEDCRDRWRNYVKCGTNRASNKWAPEEEDRLKTVITEILEAAPKLDDKAATDEEEGEEVGEEDEEEEEEEQDVGGQTAENDGKGKKKERKNSKKKKRNGSKDIINWTVVSERMGGTRSRIQCRYKWNKLLKKEAMNKIKNISEDDKRWLLEKLRDMGFTEDSQVDWEELAMLMPGRQWSGTELKLCYEKLRTSVRYYKDRTINEICKELIGYRDGSMPLGVASKN